MSGPNVVNRRQVLLEEAAQWLLRLDEGCLNTADQNRLLQWRTQSQDHERVWQAACALNHDLSLLPSDIAKPVLKRSREQRRVFLKCILGAGLTVPLGWFSLEQKVWSPLLAEYQTAIGERRTLALRGGIEITLNTSTALDASLSQIHTQIRLHRGEVFIQASNNLNQTVSVITAQGAVEAQNTDFAVRCMSNETRVSVAQGSAKIIPYRLSTTQSHWVNQGETCGFTQKSIGPTETQSIDYLAWRRGQLIAREMPLRDFLQELGRYRRGVLRCDDAIADIKVSGVFQLNNTDQALDVLIQVLHLKLKRYTDDWILVQTA